MGVAHTLFVLFQHVIVFFSLGQRDNLLDRYIYFHPDAFGAKVWRIGHKDNLSGKYEGNYYYISTFFMN